MELYKNISGNTQVKAYELKPDSITVQFVNGEVYEYTDRSAGKGHVQNMKQMAQQGEGLGTYIQTVTKHAYSMQLK